jgi:DNA-binding CsgD family transcriptional regulator
MVAQDNRIHALWDEIVRYRADEADDANRHLLRTLSGWIGATHAAWAGTVRILDGPAAESDPLYGWRGKALVFEPPFPLIQLKMARILLARYGGDPSLTAVAMARRGGAFRVNRLRDGFIDLAAFQATEHYIQHYQNLKVNDRLYIGCPVSPMAESYYIFDKRCTSDVFTEADAELAAAVVRGLTGFQLSMLLSHGIGLARSPLTATERRVVQFLLTSKLEKQIAAELGQSPNTTHGHIRNVYRRFGVRGRHELMALWLSFR